MDYLRAEDDVEARGLRLAAVVVFIGGLARVITVIRRRAVPEFRVIMAIVLELLIFPSMTYWHHTLAHPAS